MNNLVEKFSIANCNFEVVSNILISDQLWDPQPYSLFVNYYLNPEPLKNPRVTIKIVLNQTDKPIAIKHTLKELKVEGNIKSLTEGNANKQFPLFGNKGLISKYILHMLELHSKVSVFHSAAVLDEKSRTIYLALGPSGSGKSVFVGSAMKAGQKVIATEQVLFGMDRIYAGNRFDNISPAAVDFYESNLPDVIVFDDKMLVEPVGRKVFLGIEKYCSTDAEFLLRTVQQNISEKIMSPVALGKRFVGATLTGDEQVRSQAVETLLAIMQSKTFLGGEQSDFELFLAKKHE